VTTPTGTKSGRGTSPARASRAARTARPDRAAVRRAYRLGIGTGMALSLLITAVAFFTTRPDFAAARLAATKTSGSGRDAHAGHNQTASQQGGTTNGAAAAAIDVTATHLGNLQVLIQVTVSAPKTYDPITMADVSATTDMIDMPMSHTSGPIVLNETPGQPGTYQAVTTVPMIGKYDITVDVRKPMTAQAHKRITITSVAATKP
jgi:YtkA-like